MRMIGVRIEGGLSKGEYLQGISAIWNDRRSGSDRKGLCVILLGNEEAI